MDNIKQQMNTEQTIQFLNEVVKIRVAPSKTHGVGLFAMRHINKGTKLFADMFPQAYKISEGNLSKLFPDVQKHLQEVWPRMTLGEPFMWPFCFLQAYINHNNEPNYDCIMDITTRDIKEDEEIFEDYRVLKGWNKAFDWITVDKPNIDKKSIV